MSQTDTEDVTPVASLNKADRLARFKEWLKLSTDADARQRDREREDLEFQSDQWTSEARTERQGRPLLTVSLLKQPMRLVQNQAENARLGVTLTAVNETADEELAEIKQGLYQRIQRDGMADQARLWALDRAKQCGRGWYRINTQWDEDSDNPTDQEIVYERILYQEMVYPDPAAQKPDYSDGRFCFVAGYVPCDVFHERFPQAENYGAGDFDALRQSAPEWVKGKDPLVAELFYKVPDEDVAVIEHGGKKLYERKREKFKIIRVVLSGCEILEDDEWPGMYIPIVPVIGEELQPVDGERRWEGMVRPARDAQRTFNYAISALVEDIGSQSKAPYIGVAGTFAGFEKQWLESHRRNFPYLEYNALDIQGKPAPPPQRNQIDGTKMQLSLQLSQEAKSLVQVSTAVYEPSLGDVQQGAKGQSGKAIQALQQQADAGTGNYLKNLSSISMLYEARIVLDLMGYIYDRPGRVTQILGGEDEAKTVMLNQPFMPNPQTGRPQAIQVPPGQPLPPGAKNYDLSKGRYAVAVNVGKSFQTRLEQGATEMGQILSGSPELMPVIGDLYFKFRDFPGAKEISERLAKWREKQIPGLGEQKDGAPTPEQLQAQNQALQEQVKQMQEQLQQAAEAIKTDQAKQQATIQKAEMDAQAKAQQAEMQASMDDRLAKFEAAHEVAMENDRQQAAEALQATKLAFERWKVEFQAAHDVGMAAAGGNTLKRVSDHGQSNESEDGHETNDTPREEPAE